MSELRAEDVAVELEELEWLDNMVLRGTARFIREQDSNIEALRKALQAIVSIDSSSALTEAEVDAIYMQAREALAARPGGSNERS